MMKTRVFLALLLTFTLPLVAHPAAPVPPAERVYVGMVADEGAGAGLLVRAVAPGSPAHKAGICAGDIVMRVAGVPMESRAELRNLVANGVAGQVVAVELLRAKRPMTLQVVLQRRPDAPARQSSPEATLGADRHFRPIELPATIREEIRRHRRLLREQLASLPDGLVPPFVTEELNAIRNLARDAHANRPGWMSGRAGEISVRFRDEEGSVILYGANNLVSVELYDLEGKLLARYDLNTEAERRALPEAVLQRLRRFR